jgi:hypothetical protein
MIFKVNHETLSHFMPSSIQGHDILREKDGTPTGKHAHWHQAPGY